MEVIELWRYPVKSMRGEPLAEAEVGQDGIYGDRRVIVVDAETKRIVTSRTRPRLLGLTGTLGPDGQPRVDGRRWDDPESGRLVAAAAGPNARLLVWDGPERFDILPLSVLSDGAVASLGYDHRRLRPNILIGGVDGLAERTWPGRRMRVGDEVIIDFVQLRGRCVMTTYDPDTLEQDHKVLRRIVEEFSGLMSLDTAVIRGGRIRVGDRVELLD